MRRFVISLCLAVMASTAPALADAMPQIDVEPACRAYAIRGNVDVANVAIFCVQRNSDARDTLSLLWHSAHEDVRQKCAHLPLDQPFPYTAMLSCVARGERFYSKERHPAPKP